LQEKSRKIFHEQVKNISCFLFNCWENTKTKTLVGTAPVYESSSDGPLEEAGAAVAGEDAVVLPGAGVPSHHAQQPAAATATLHTGSTLFPGGLFLGQISAIRLPKRYERTNQSAASNVVKST
jgi:hypothetical protein